MIFSKYKVFAGPTETVPGLFCRYSDHNSIQTIFEIKKRDYSKPLLILSNSLDKVIELYQLNNYQLDFIHKNNVSDMTFVVPLKSLVEVDSHLFMVDGLKRYSGFRVTHVKWLSELINEIGLIAQTSLNHSGEDPIMNSHDIPQDIRSQIDFIYEFHYKSLQKPSTIVKLFDNHFEIVRLGNATIIE
ncbi:Sua5/YciO/YrdC/YwlC family protein [bacterium]|nr:MAG: Sua5/YciO/YrdC/YwlC family protein [bacterium]